MKKRSSGILMHISSLPSEYGIGDFGKEAYKFVDFLKKSKQKNWQILPLGVTGYGDSPYQCFSAFAGNPYFIDLDELVEQGYVEIEEIKKKSLGKDPHKVDYGILYKNKMAILRKAYKNSHKTLNNELEEFYKLNKDWLREFALYMALKTHHKNASWLNWEPKYKDIASSSVINFEKENHKEIYFWVFTQYFFYKQWNQLKQYANENNINIIGDLPIYVAEDSSDIWANPELFNLDKNLKPVTVAGCPPDAFAKKGQLWGNPIYDWDSMEKDGYKWWIKRIKHSFETVDVLRIDHFRGFESYWEVKYGAKDAVKGRWTKGPSIKLFKKIKEELGELNIIAEDLGFLTDEVHELINATGFPGMKVLQFAFDTREESDYLPHNYTKNSVVYTGTHDNETTTSWIYNIPKDEFHLAVKYLKLNFDEGLTWGMIRGAWSSVSYLAIAPMQDFLELDNNARMNTPSTLGNNWIWRMDKNALTDELANRIADMTKIYGR